MKFPPRRSIAGALPPTVFVAEVCSGAMVEAFHALLSDAERRRADEFRFAVDRAAYCSAHYLLRACLTLLAGPEEWRFETDQNGKPYLHPACAKEGLQFNISHSRTKVACAIWSDGLIGVDTEDDFAGTDLLDIAARVCSEAEFGNLSKLQGQARHWAFTRLWTAKEAVAKAMGVGLSLDFRRFTLDWERKTFRGGRELGDPQAWTIEHRLCGKSHVSAALRARSRMAEAASVEWKQVELTNLRPRSNRLGWDIEAVVAPDEPRHIVTVA
jgi:4'-phosphopantetheinyl transferase